MSFSSDPFRTLTLIEQDGRYFALCDGCGADSKRAGVEPITVFEPVDRLVQWKHDHVRRSHKYEPQDTESWGAHGYH